MTSYTFLSDCQPFFLIEKLVPGLAKPISLTSFNNSECELLKSCLRTSQLPFAFRALTNHVPRCHQSICRVPRPSVSSHDQMPLSIPPVSGMEGATTVAIYSLWPHGFDVLTFVRPCTLTHPSALLTHAESELSGSLVCSPPLLVLLFNSNPV